MRRSLIHLACTVLQYSGINLALRPFLGGRGAILMFHRVLAGKPRPAFNPTGDIAVTPEHLSRTIRALRQAGYDIVSLDEAQARIEGARAPRKFACLTFDDGYRDNYEFAYPVCAEADAPMAIYVTTGFIDGAAMMWWYGLEALVAGQGSVAFAHRGRQYAYETATLAGKTHAYWRMEKLFRAASAAEKSALARHFERDYGVDFMALSKDQAMSWDMLRELAGKPGVEIGAHTLTHPGLSVLDAEAARTEIAESRRILEERLSCPVRHFAYPYGDPGTTGEREFGICRELGFATATTTEYGNLLTGHRGRMHSLPRWPVSPDDSALTMASQLSGSLALMHRAYRRLKPAYGHIETDPAAA